MAVTFKLHRPIANVITTCLHEILSVHKPADKVLEKNFKVNPKLGSRDRGLVASFVYDIVRNNLLIRYCIGSDNYWHSLGAWILLKGDDIPEWEEFKALDKNTILKLRGIGDSIPKVRYSIPDELDEIGINALKERWYTEIEAMHLPAPMVMRVNTLKTTRPEIEKFLKQNSIKYSLPNDDKGEAVIIKQRINLFSSPIFQEGLVEVQDYASQQIAWYLDPQPGERIIDACAGAGGKALHIAALMKNKGRILALDIEDYKLETLKKRARRAAADLIETRWIENNKVIKRLENQADKLLLDVPCTGSGVLKRNPDAKYRITEKYLTELTEKQHVILNNYSKMVKPGGLLVYVTCSIFYQENQDQINTFLAKNSDFEFVDDKNLWPSEFGFDGFYIAKLRKKN